MLDGGWKKEEEEKLISCQFACICQLQVLLSSLQGGFKVVKCILIMMYQGLRKGPVKEVENLALKNGLPTQLHNNMRAYS